MIEKMKKKVSKFKASNKAIKILKKGRYKDKNGDKIFLKDFIESSAKKSIVSRADAIPTQADVIIPGSSNDVPILTTTNRNDLITKIYHKIPELADYNDNYTIVHCIEQKGIDKAFDFLDDNIIGKLLRTSTLATTYAELKPKWLLLHDDQAIVPNVMFIPDIHVFLNGKTAKPLDAPYKVNLLLLSLAPKKAYREEMEVLDDDNVITEVDIITSMIKSIIESAIKCGAKHLIIDPFGYSLFANDEHQTTNIWRHELEVSDVPKQIGSIDFCVDDEDSYIIFTKTATIL